MPTSSFILFPHGPTWQIATVIGGHVTFADMLPPTDEQGFAQPQIIARRLAEELARLGYTGQGVMLALPSSDCLAASIETAGLLRGDRKAMLYRLEEKLPMAAESIVADFAIGDGRALGVCVREDAVSPLLHSLESCGVAVQSIVPAALLSAQQLTDGKGSQIWLIGEADQINVIAIRDGVPSSWSLLPNQLADLKLHLDVLSMESDSAMTISMCGISGAILDGLSARSIPTPPRQVAAIFGAAALENRLKPWIEFRRGSLAISDRMRLHRKAFDALLAAAAIFLICLTLSLVWRAHRYSREAQTADRKMGDEFSTAFPGWSVPANVRTVVESERRKLGAPGGGLPPQARESALQMLHTILSRLPPDVKFKIESMTFQEQKFEMAGRVRDFADVDTLASTARQAGLEVALPQRHRDAEGYWSFTLNGTRPVHSSVANRQ